MREERFLGSTAIEEAQTYVGVSAVSFVSANIRKPPKGVDFLPSLLAANAISFSTFLF